MKEKIRIKAFHYLVQLQQTHNKSKNVKYEELKLQDYLSPKNEMTIKEKSFVFAARTRMMDVKGNFKQGK